MPFSASQVASIFASSILSEFCWIWIGSTCEPMMNGFRPLAFDEIAAPEPLAVVFGPTALQYGSTLLLLLRTRPPVYSLTVSP